MINPLTIGVALNDKQLLGAALGRSENSILRARGNE